jgi:hypothetical protein
VSEDELVIEGACAAVLARFDSSFSMTGRILSRASKPIFDSGMINRTVKYTCINFAEASI